jgi:hypothetical protein
MKVLLILLLCSFVAATAAMATTDLSAVDWGLWPVNAYRPPLPPGAFKALAPPGAVKSITSASRGKIRGTNRLSMWVWVTACMQDSRKYFTIWRKGSCGNPSEGGWEECLSAKTTPSCEMTAVAESRTCVTSVVNTTTNVTIQNPQPIYAWGLGQATPAFYTPRTGYTEEKTTSLVDGFAWKNNQNNQKQEVKECTNPEDKTKEPPFPSVP